MSGFSSAGSGQLVLLTENSGTSSATSLTNVDTVAISGLTAKDHLFVLVEQETLVTAQTVATVLYSTTDSLILAQLSRATGLAIGGFDFTEAHFGPTAGSTTRLVGVTTGTSGSVAADQDGSSANAASSFLLRTPATAWTASWTMALRLQNGAGGSTKWKWTVYKVAGQ